MSTLYPPPLYIPNTTMATTSSPILVTGGSGYIGSHLILHLLNAGHTVHTTVRSLTREASVREALAEAGAPADTSTRLTFFAADLNSDDGWEDAVKGCEFVHHVASPFPLELPKHEDELIIPARDGALRVLRAAKAAGVKRVVLTSSFAAVGYGWGPERTEIFTEKDWSIIDGSKGVSVPPYQKSKTIAERAAWDYVEKEGGDLELVVVNPVGVFGPVIGKDIGTSVEIVKKLMDGSVPGCPQLQFGAVDVRDIADLHILAMNDPKAKGERFLGTNGVVSMLDIARIIREKRPDNAKKVPTRELPNWLIKCVAFFDASIRQILPELGRTMEISNDKAKTVLGWSPRPVEESIVDTVDNLVKSGVV
jgi:nucleoside-diphosphate-sugar epimerase